jgi:hypothetical protein
MQSNKKMFSSTKRKRDLQFILFILTGIISVSLIVISFLGILPFSSLTVLIPMGLMMHKNTQLWDFYNDVLILQQYMFDEDFRNEYDNEHNI